MRFETVGVPYCGVPFFVAGLKILQCQSYRGRGGRKKKEIKIEVRIFIFIILSAELEGKIVVMGDLGAWGMVKFQLCDLVKSLCRIYWQMFQGFLLGL